MKKDSITKLYDSLTGAERAALAFHYLASENKLEFERVLDSAPCADAELPNRIDDYFDLAAGWGLAYWQCRCRWTAAMWCLRDLEARGDLDQITAIAKTVEGWEARLSALDIALQEVCTEHGIGADSVRRMVGAELFEPTFPALVPDNELRSELHGYLSRLLLTAD